MTPSRRKILKAAALGGLAALMPAGTRAVLASGQAGANIIVFALMRGGMDGLNLLAPADDADLIAARPEGLRPAVSGANAGIALDNGPSANDWRLHPGAVELKAFYDAGSLAFVHAAGIPADSRSHFEMQAMLEHGVADPQLLSRTNGWIGQYALSAGLSQGSFAVVSGTAAPPASLQGDQGAVSLPDPRQFSLGSAMRGNFLQAAYGGVPGTAGRQGQLAIAAVNAFQALHATYPPPAGYGGDPFAKGLSVIAELIKLGVGLEVAEVEYTNWDTHVNQPPRFANCVSVLSKGLGAFYADLGPLGASVTTVVMSEFGRRVQSNANNGTDHGHGNVMLVLGGGVKGGRILGEWPGLAPSVLDQGDVPVATDYRSVLWEVFAARKGGMKSTVFAGFSPAPPLGLIA